MKHEVTLIDGNIRGPMDGEMCLGIEVDGQRKATLDYSWTEEHFTARFVGHAPSMPVPAHPTVFLRKPIEAIQALKRDKDELPTEVLQRQSVYFEIT